jgi:iron complex outermembrane receptor protein
LAAIMGNQQLITSASLLICIFLSSGLALAQDEPTSVGGDVALDEVLVTAQRRVQNLQHVPVSVTAFAGDRIQEGDITGIRDIALETPNFTFTQFNVGEPEYFIRGIGNTNDSAGADPAVGTFIDDVYIGRTGGTAMELYELDRVEVLRGPQGALFGKNVVGGAISIYTRKPTTEFAGRIGVTVGNYNARTLRGLINGSISDTVSGIFTFSKHDRDGYVDNVIDGLDYQDENNLSLRGQLLFQPSDSLEILAGLDYSTDDLSGNCRNVNNLTLNDPLGLAALYPPVIAARTGGDIRKCASSVAAGQDRDVAGALLRVNWQLSGSEFTSITAYREADYVWAEDLAGLPLGETPFNLVDQAHEDSDQVSQEFRLTSFGGSELDWLLGVYYMQENVDRSETFIASFAEPIASQGFALLDGDVTFAQINRTQSYAIFGKLDWALNDSLTLSIGARWAWDEKEIDQGLINNEDPAFDVGLLTVLSHPDPQLVLGIPANGPDELFGYLATGDASLLRTAYAVTAEDSWNEFLPSASLNWWFTDHSMLYLAAARGYKSGAFQSQTTSPGAAVTPLDPEIATNYEIGVKSEFFYNRIRVNASAFRINYTDLQVFQLVGSLLVGGNAEATSSGFEVEFAAMINEDWYVSATLGYQNPEYDTYLLGNLDYSGNRLPRASKRSWSVNSNYAWLLQNGSEFNLQASYAYKSDFYFDPSNLPAAQEDGYGMLDARISWQGERWAVSGWGRNLTDEEFRINTFISNIAGTVDLWSLPRTYGVTVAYNF